MSPWPASLSWLSGSAWVAKLLDTGRSAPFAIESHGGNFWLRGFARRGFHRKHFVNNGSSGRDDWDATRDVQLPGIEQHNLPLVACQVAASHHRFRNWATSLRHERKRGCGMGVASEQCETDTATPHGGCPVAVMNNQAKPHASCLLFRPKTEVKLQGADPGTAEVTFPPEGPSSGADIVDITPRPFKFGCCRWSLQLTRQRLRHRNTTGSQLPWRVVIRAFSSWNFWYASP